jgi:hypothetical protein
VNPPSVLPTRRRIAKSRTGATLFEFAITLPLTLLICLAVLDFAKISFLRFLISDAAGAASRFASTVPANINSIDLWQQQLENVAKDSLLDSPWIDPSELNVLPCTIEQIDADERRITVQIEYTFNTVFDWLSVDRQTILASEVTVYGAP